MQLHNSYLYPCAQSARRAFAEAWVTGDGLHSPDAVAQMIAELEDTAETITAVAAHLGDRHQRATPPAVWAETVLEVAMEYWRRCND